VAVLEDLDSRLSVGLNFRDYGERVGDAKVAYDKIVIADLSPDCVSRVGAPAETALNDYIAADDRWNRCIKSLSCKTSSIESELQAKWSDATSQIHSAKAALGP
jgi:hypothetical protein